MTHFSRRHFLTTVSVAATIPLLKGCLGNPPDDALSKSAKTIANVKSVVKPGEEPEVKMANLGYLPIVEAAPLIVAFSKGFFAKHGMTEIKIQKQANWGAARDNIKIGSQGGGLDGGQWQMPMPYLISEGIITDKTKVPMYILCQLNTQGNGIALANKHKGKGLGLNLKDKASYFKEIAASGNRFKAAYTFPKSNQEFWIRYWLAAGGVDPDTDVELLTVPTAQTVADMKRGAMDAFSTGDPLPNRIVSEGFGFTPVLTAEMWKAHPEEYFGMRKEWVDRHPLATQAILKGIMEAQQWCDNFENRKELASILSAREYFGVSEALLLEPLMGKYNLGERQVDDKTMAVLYWKDSKGSVSYPYKSHDLWFLTESVRWGFLPKETLTDAKKLIDEVNREDLWKKAAKSLGVAAADIPTSTSRGVEKFFDGVEFDPANPQGYLDSLKIKKV
jgi:bicarbonate transport system substrate-binding protein